jgi:hypothetical protein
VAAIQHGPATSAPAAVTGNPALTPIPNDWLTRDNPRAPRIARMPQFAGHGQRESVKPRAQLHLTRNSAPSQNANLTTRTVPRQRTFREQFRGFMHAGYTTLAKRLRMATMRQWRIIDCALHRDTRLHRGTARDPHRRRVPLDANGPDAAAHNGRGHPGRRGACARSGGVPEAAGNAAECASSTTGPKPTPPSICF